MQLTDDQQSILQGEQGRALSLAMKTLVDCGNAFNARRLVPIKSAHMAGSFGARFFKGYFDILDMMVREDLKVKVPTTVNPRPGREMYFLSKIAMGTQTRLEKYLDALGVTPNYSCVCYEGANVPAFGDLLCWSESSAVQFANSVIGARSNRNSVIVDLCSAVLGLTPEFGYILDENRLAQIHVKLNIDTMDPSALGFVIGQRVTNRVPVIEHYPFNRAELKNMGGAMAASGAVALFHVEGLTPEAPDLATVSGGKPLDSITITQRDLDELRAPKPESADIVVFGCPQLTYDEAFELAGRFVGKKVEKPTYFCMIPEARKRFEGESVYRELESAGVKIVDFCPLAGFTFRRRNTTVLVGSGKCYYYLHGSVYGTVEDCLRACGVK